MTNPPPTPRDTMSDPTTADAMVQAVVAGFDALQDEYQKLAGQHQALERKLATAREQVSIRTFLSQRIGGVHVLLPGGKRAPRITVMTQFSSRPAVLLWGAVTDHHFFMYFCLIRLCDIAFVWGFDAMGTVC